MERVDQKQTDSYGKGLWGSKRACPEASWTTNKVDEMKGSKRLLVLVSDLIGDERRRWDGCWVLLACG